MKKIFILFLICGVIRDYSQAKSKCKLTFIKEHGTKVYTHVDSTGAAVGEDVLFEFINPDSIHFNKIIKKHPAS